MDRAGVKGVRFNFIKRLVDSTPKDVMQRIAARIARLGWHVVVYFEQADLDEMGAFLKSLPTVLVFDHMACPKVKEGVDGADFQKFLRFMDANKNCYSKVTCPERFTLAGPPYDDVVPFARTVVERFPDRVLWGTDWPHPNMPKEAPDDGLLVDMIPKIAPTAALQKQLLIDNPMRLYWT
jgi:2-pyrone-4,6-dicarboxylate lactonase